MKKIALFVVGIIAGIIAVSNLGSMIGLVLSALIAYAGIHYYQKNDAALLKLFWGGVLIIGLLTAISNIPAFVGIVALISLYYVWKSWEKEQDDTIIEEPRTNDPFVNFEKQWYELNKKNR